MRNRGERFRPFAPQNTDLSTIHPGLAALLFRLYMRCASSWARFFSQSAYSALPFGATSAHRSVLNRYFLLAVLVGSAHALSDCNQQTDEQPHQGLL